MLTAASVRSATVRTGLAARGVVQGVVGRGFSFAFAYLATIVLARWLAPTEYGVYGVIVSVLIGWYGPIGAAHSSALAGLSGAVILGVLVFRRFGPLVTPRTLLNMAVATTALVVVARLFPRAGSASGCRLHRLPRDVQPDSCFLREVLLDNLEPFAFSKWGFR
jgi:hypothetical protein